MTPLEDPDDVAASLVYADWLQRQGDPRGELVAIQCQLETVDDPALRAREKEILDAHLVEWMGGDVAGPRIKLAWRRGFLDELALDYRGADLAGQARLLTSPLCRFVRRLALRTNVPEGLELLLRSPALERLETLNLGSYRWSHYSTRGLAARFPDLLHLDCDADGADLADLRFVRLESLGLALNGFTETNLESLASAELPGLTSLLLWGGRMTEQRAEDDETPWFATARFRRVLDGSLPSLRTLDFEACSFGDELVDALIGSRLLRDLTSLAVDDDAISEAGYARLRDHTGHVRRVKLRG